MPPVFFRLLSFLVQFPYDQFLHFTYNFHIEWKMVNPLKLWLTIIKWHKIHLKFQHLVGSWSDNILLVEHVTGSPTIFYESMILHLEIYSEHRQIYYGTIWILEDLKQNNEQVSAHAKFSLKTKCPCKEQYADRENFIPFLKWSTPYLCRSYSITGRPLVIWCMVSVVGNRQQW